MADSSLGTLGVNIAAYAGQFMAEITRAENTATKFQRSLSKTITKAGLDTLGLGNAARALSNEFRYVYENIEKIPGIDPATIASVKEMHAEVDEFNNSVHQLVAQGMSIFSQFGKALGAVAGAIATAFDRTDFKDLFLNPSLFAANFAVALQDIDTALQAEFDAAVRAAHAENAHAKAMATATVETKKAKEAKAEWLVLLEKVSKENEEFSRTEEQRMEALRGEGETIRREVLTPQEEWAEQLVRLDELLRANAISQETFNRAMRGADAKFAAEQFKETADAIESVRKKVFAGEDDVAIDFDRTESAADRFKESMTDMWRELSHDGSEAFVKILESGENVFGDLVSVVARSVERMAAELLVINPILNAVSGIFGVGSSLPAAWSFAGGKAAGGPVSQGKTYMVGERGPELFVPQTSGSIVPNHDLRAGGGGDVKNFYIDARGADRTGLARLEEMIRSLNGSIEARSVAAVIDFRRRGASSG